MKEITIIIDGKEIKAEIDDTIRQQLLQPVKKTGYERVEKKKDFHFVGFSGDIITYVESLAQGCADCYDNANYYSDRTVAENNARADKLMRQLRRFAVEHREKELDWKDDCQNKYQIVFDHDKNNLGIERNQFMHYCSIHFDSYETAQLAIDTFKDELLWYFTEYKDSL